MSAKVYAFDSPRTLSSGRRKSRDIIDQDTSPKPSPRVRGNSISGDDSKSNSRRGHLSRQNSLGGEETKTISRQSSFQARISARGRRVTGLDDDAITDHSGASSARGKNKSVSRKSSKSSSSKKKVVFKVPLIDPRPEKDFDFSMTYGTDNSINDEDYKRLQETDKTPRRMKKPRKGSSGRWRRYIPFGQYIPTLPSLFCSVFWTSSSIFRYPLCSLFLGILFSTLVVVRTFCESKECVDVVLNFGMCFVDIWLTLQVVQLCG